MVFSSLLFIFVFLPLSLVLFYSAYFFSNGNKTTLYGTLTILSLLFYVWGSGKLVLLLLISIAINYCLGNILANPSAKFRKELLIAGIVANISSLVYFKYGRFFLDSLGTLADVQHQLVPEFHPYLPVGISFYTFMSISYLVEVYRNAAQRAPFLQFGTYMTLFPHLVAGPIVRFSEITGDFKLPTIAIDTFYRGVIRFSQGLAMKVLIADNLSATVDKVFAIKQNIPLTFSEAWLGAVCYTFQIYFDFAGYSAMAIGLALMFGFHFPENFNRPYLASSVTEFWKRWHMSLSRWLMDYLYIPLGGNRNGAIRTYINLFIVFLVCGLWHGAAWTFIVWGVYQGCLLICERILKQHFSFEFTGPAGVAITFFLVTIGWVIFRSESLQQSYAFFSTMMSIPEDISLPSIKSQLGLYLDPLLFASLVAAAFFSFFPFHIFKSATVHKFTKPIVISEAIVTVAMLFLSVSYAAGNTYKPFIYFRF